MFKIAIFASGKGSNFEAILNYFKENDLVEFSCLVCDQPQALAIEIAKKYGIEVYMVNTSKYKTRLDNETEMKLSSYLQDKKIELIVLAGYMRVIKAPLLNAFSKKIINIHPSLLPSFKGLNPVEQALNYGVKITGCTVHYVNEEIDSGNIISQRAVNISDNDNIETLHNKIHKEEHIIYPKVIEEIALAHTEKKKNEWKRLCI